MRRMSLHLYSDDRPSISLVKIPFRPREVDKKNPIFPDIYRGKFPPRPSEDRLKCKKEGQNLLRILMASENVITFLISKPKNCPKSKKNICLGKYKIFFLKPAT
jgi:hypothetical protein